MSNEALPPHAIFYRRARDSGTKVWVPQARSFAEVPVADPTDLLGLYSGASAGNTHREFDVPLFDIIHVTSSGALHKSDILFYLPPKEALHYLKVVDEHHGRGQEVIPTTLVDDWSLDVFDGHLIRPGFEGSVDLMLGADAISCVYIYWTLEASRMNPSPALSLHRRVQGDQFNASIEPPAVDGLHPFQFMRWLALLRLADERTPAVPGFTRRLIDVLVDDWTGQRDRHRSLTYRPPILFFRILTAIYQHAGPFHEFRIASWTLDPITDHLKWTSTGTTEKAGLKVFLRIGDHAIKLWLPIYHRKEINGPLAVSVDEVRWFHLSGTTAYQRSESLTNLRMTITTEVEDFVKLAFTGQRRRADT